MGMKEARRTMTLNLTDAEMAVLEQLSERKDISKTAVLRQALRLYQLVDRRTSEGKRVFLEDDLHKRNTDIIIL